MHLSEGGSHCAESRVKKRNAPHKIIKANASNFSSERSKNIFKNSIKRGTQESISSEKHHKSIKARFGKKMLGSDQSSQKQSVGGTSIRSGKLNIFKTQKKNNIFNPNRTIRGSQHFKRGNRIMTVNLSGAKEKPKACLPKFNKRPSYKNKTRQKEILVSKKPSQNLEERKESEQVQESRKSHDSQTGSSFRGSSAVNSSFVTFGRPSFVREEAGEIERCGAEQG
ncbi:unnamed protein product [Moneuplotes crassus]|uniref:Uncharacterized protein n=1 Tax=Euplotes crassus TaxID=5936 RepID=A0AAD1UIC7_EUPCR|nr:unnamed protein product [Moneuplotes crassus]